LIVLCSVAALALVWARKFRQPEPPPVSIPEPDAREMSPIRRAVLIVIIMIVFMLIPFVILSQVQSAAAQNGIALDWNRNAFMIITGTGVLAILLMMTLLLKRRHEASRPQTPIPPVTPAAEETPKDVFEMTDSEIRQKLGLEAPGPAPVVSPPDPDQVSNLRTRRTLVMIIGILAGMGAPLIILLTMIADGELTNRSTGEVLAIFGICAFALIMAVVMIVFFGLQTKK
jgi:drug/metabolite transporter (DMT)-like permease